MTDPAQTPRHGTFAKRRIGLCGESSNLSADAAVSAFQALNEVVNHNIAPFSDQAIGPGRKFDDEIRQKLQEADYLLVFFTGALKPSHSYTGFEIGYFRARIDDQQASDSDKQIVSFFLKQPPDPTSEIQGIDISISAEDLSLSRDDYVRSVAAVAAAPHAKPDALTQFFTQVLAIAEKRKPFPRNEDTAAKVARYRAVQEKIVPSLRGDLYDCISSRVARSSVEQRFIRFELPKPATAHASLATIPDDARLTEEGDAFQLFGIKAGDEGILWQEFRQQLDLRGTSISPVLYAIERALVSVVSPDATDSDQIIKAPHDNNLYRIIVTEQMEYFDGRLVVHMWFIRFLNRDQFGNKDTSVLLSFILVASKYRFLFLEKESPLSVEAFRLESNPESLKEKVRRLLRETILIEEESHVFQLDTAAALVLIAGDADLREVGVDMDNYGKKRVAMELAANAIVAVASDFPEFQHVRDDWMAALDAFLESSGKINSVYTTRALSNLEKHFRAGG